MSGVVESSTGGVEASEQQQQQQQQDEQTLPQHEHVQSATTVLTADPEKVETSGGGEVPPRSSMPASQHDETSTSEPDGKQVGGAAAAVATATPEASHSEAPACLLNFRDRVEACSHRVQAWSDEKELQARERKVRRRDDTDGGVRIEEDGRVIEPRGDSFLQRKGIIALVALILSWVYVAFGWRVCANAIRQKSYATATRSEGIGLLVAFNVLWLMTVWSYIKAISTGPGYVRDHMPISDPPSSPQEDEFRFPRSVLPVVQIPAQQMQQQQPVQQQHPERVSHDDAGATVPTQDSVDSTLAATLGPIGIGLVNRADEGSKVRSTLPNGNPTASGQPSEDVSGQQQHDGVAKEQTTPVQPNAAEPADALVSVLAMTPFYPEPIRIPRTAKPLHPSTTYCYRCRRHKPPRAHHCRHCGTCVLKMDHHCPWVGGCVGAQNHKFFYNFLQWVTLLEWFVLITNAIMFRRGILRSVWPLDGYMISLFPIASLFAIFTMSLLIMHSYLFVLNLSTIEHMGYDRQKVREDILIDNWFNECRQREGKPKPNWFAQLRERNALKSKWTDFWGSPKTENNPWWLDGCRTPTLVTLPTKDEIAAQDPQHSAPVTMNSDVVRPVAWWQAVGTNWRQAMGDNVLGWALPIGRARNANGLQYEGNWRFGRLGEWTPRQLWASRVQSANMSHE